MVKQPIFRTLCIERDVFECSYVQQIIRQMPNAKIELIDNIAEQIDKTFVAPYPQDSEGAQKVFIGKQRGVFIRPCPCSLQTKRCGYHYLSLGVGCNMECSYCFLQGFLNTSSPILYTNFEDMECELQEWENKMQSKGKILRLGTGEMTDSLLFEPMTGYARILIQIFKKYPHLHLELKTKTPFVDNSKSKRFSCVVIKSTRNNRERRKRSSDIRAKINCSQKSYRCWIFRCISF